MAKNTPPPGTSDIFPDEIPVWYNFEEKARAVFSLYGYGELRTPVIEYTEVFQRSLGDDTEVVQKEMYTFEDRGGRSLTLRPEGTAGVMRALSGTDVMNGNEKRVFYIGPMFRGERPAKGRKRQFHQVGVECVGRVAPELDAENIAMLIHYLEELGIKGCKLHINTRGVQADREPAEVALREFFKDKIDSMCADCRARYEKNIWRILDCKVDVCKEVVDKAPNMVDFFTDESKKYFETVCSSLDKMGVEYVVEPRLVRGLDYYVHTVFEVTHDAFGENNTLALAGGGRYELYLPGNKKPVIGVGFAAGLERLQMIQEALNVEQASFEQDTVYLVSLGSAAKEYNIKLAAELRKNNIRTLLEVEDRSMKAQMRSANKSNAKFTLILGENELESSIIMCKDMELGEQIELSLNEVVDYLLKRIK